MRPALAYSPRPGPLGRARPLVAAIYLGPLAVVAFSFSSPLVLAAAGGAGLLAAAASGALRPALAPLRYGLVLAATVIAVNALVSDRGDTILLPRRSRARARQRRRHARGARRGQHPRPADPRRARRLRGLVGLRRSRPDPQGDPPLRGALGDHGDADLAARAACRRRLDAPAGGGIAARPGSRARRPAALARRLVAGSLDRSVDVAATLELRGFGLGTRPARVRYRRRRGEIAMLVAGLGMIAASRRGGDRRLG